MSRPVRGDDLERSIEHLRVMSRRIAQMNKSLVDSYCEAEQAFEEDGELKSKSLNHIRSELRKYETQREKLDERMLELDQLLNS